MTMVHPGSIQARVGSCLRMIEVNIEQQDLPGMANFVRLLVTYCKPYLNAAAKVQADLNRIPPFNYDKPEAAAFEDEMRRVELCLSLLKEHNLYGYSSVPISDATDYAEEEIEA